MRARLRDCGVRGGSRSAAKSSAIGRTGAADWGPVRWSEWSVVGMRGSFREGAAASAASGVRPRSGLVCRVLAPSLAADAVLWPWCFQPGAG